MEVRLTIRVIIADDHAIVRQGIKAVLDNEKGIEVVGEAANGSQAVEKVCELMPDVVLMDVRMPGTSGISAAKSIRMARPEVKILALSAYGSDEDVLASLEAGVCGYVLKDMSPSKLGHSIKTVYEGKLELDPSIAQRLLDKAVTDIEASSKPELKLTKRENDVLQLLGKGLRNKEIAARLWISEKTVKVYVSNLLRKLEVESRLALILKATELKLVNLDK